MFFLIAFFVAKGKSVYKNGPKRQRIPIKERQHYAELILGGADYSTINLMYKKTKKGWTFLDGRITIGRMMLQRSWPRIHQVENIISAEEKDQHN